MFLRQFRGVIYKSILDIRFHRKFSSEILTAAKSPQQRFRSTNPSSVINNSKRTASMVPNAESKEKVNFPRLELQYQRATEPLLKNLFSHVRSKGLFKSRLIIVEGRRLIAEALKCELKLEALLFSKVEDLQALEKNIGDLSRLCESPIYKVSRHSLKIWSVLDTPPGLLAIFHRPNGNQLVKRTDILPITVVCDNVREPANLGSLIRTCAAVPCTNVVTMKGCCDPWSPKSLRGGSGGQFHINILDNVVWEDLPKVLPNDFSVFIAESNLIKLQASTPEKQEQNIIRYDELTNTRPHNVVIIGGETHGISEDAYRFLFNSHSSSKFLHIPLAKGIESLNLASALTLILYEMKKHIEQLNKRAEEVQTQQ